MKWVSHLAIGAAVCAVFNPVAVPAALAGATAPDWLETLESALTGRRVRHRAHTHWLAAWVLLLAFAALVWDWRGLVFWFAAGAVLHWIGDALTLQGVPVGWWSDRRVHLAGGRLRTGGAGEYLVAGLVVAACAGVIYTRQEASGFLPFFYQWGVMYEKGIVDGIEWRANRFNLL